MSRQHSPSSPLLDDDTNPTMVTQEDHLRLQREFQDAHNKLGDRIASLAVDFKEYQRNTTSSFDELKAMLSSRRHRSSSSASSHRSSRHHKSNHEAHAQTHHRNGKEPQNFATERERRNHMSRHVHEAFNLSTQHQGASTYHALTSRHEGGDPTAHPHVSQDVRSSRQQPPLRQLDMPSSTIRPLEGRTNAPPFPPFDHEDYYNDNTHQMKSVLGA